MAHGGWQTRHRRTWRLSCITLAAVVSLLGAASAETDSSGASPPHVSCGLVSGGTWLQVWGLYPPETVKADDELPREPHLERLCMSAARGEREPFLLVARSTVPMSRVTPVSGELRSSTGNVIPADRVSVRRLAWITVDRPSGSPGLHPALFSTGPGAYPEVITNDRTGALRPGRNLAFWVTVDVPEDATPGIYRGELSVDFQTQDWIRKATPTPRLTLELRVYGFRLPRPSPLRNLTYMGVERLPDEWLTPDRRCRVYQRATEIRGAVDPLLPSPNLKVFADGRIEIDTAEWEKTAAYCLDDLRAPFVLLPVWPLWSERKRSQGPFQGLYWLWHWPNVAKQRWPAVSPVFVADDEGRLRPEFRRAFGGYLEHMNDLVRRRGWGGRVFVTTMDEPYTYHSTGDARRLDTPANNYRVVAELCDLVHGVAPELRTLVTADPVPELVGKIDHWCLRTFAGAPTAPQRAAVGDTVTFIDNYRSIIDFPLVSSRTFGWLAWKVGAAGWINSESLAFFDQAWEGAVFAPPIPNAPVWWGAMMLFYPDPLTHELLPSLRWEMMREGCDDYEYLWLLAAEVQHLGPTAPVAAAADGLLERSLSMADPRVSAESGKPPPGAATTYANVQRNAAVWELRCQVGDLLDSLSWPEPPGDADR